MNNEKNFQKALTLHQNGKIEEAKNLYQTIIRKNPNHFNVLNLLGVIEAQVGNYDEGIKWINRAIKINPYSASFYVNKANILKQQGNLQEAIIDYRRAIQLDQQYVMAIFNLGLVYIDLKNWEESANFFEKIIKFDPTNAQAYYYMGNIKQEKNQYEEAINYYDTALKFNEKLSEAYTQKGNCYQKIEKWELSLDNYNKAIEINQNDIEAYTNRGNSYRYLKNPHSAIENYKNAIAIEANNPESYFNLGLLYLEQNDYLKAIESFDQAILNNSEFIDAHWNKAIALLMNSDFEEGWKYFEWRWKREDRYKNIIKTNKPKINITTNESLQNKKLLVWNEQGVGDEILFAGLFSELFKVAPKTKILIDQRLIPLYKRSMPEGDFLDKNTPISDIEFDEHLPTGDLGKYFRKKVNNFKIDRNKYLIADKNKSLNLRAQIKNQKLICGISWKSQNKNISNGKSISLLDLLPILSIKEIEFINLQYGDVTDEINAFNMDHGISIKEITSIDNFNDLDGHASLIDTCDFVVTVSNTTAHIAGAIGKQTYLLYPMGKGALWYWANQINSKNIWYPSITVYQQNIGGNWSEVIKSIKNEIIQKVDDDK